MTAEQTAAVHREIEQFAAAMLDAEDQLRNASLNAPAAHIDAFNRATAAVEAMAPLVAISEGDTRFRQFDCGPELALTLAALTITAFGKDRPPLDCCPHVDGPPGMVTGWIYVALRRWTCAECWHPSPEDLARLDADNTCDVCLQPASLLTPITSTFLDAIAIIHAGPCCTGLFEYATPSRTINYHACGRNERCPCGSGRKVKHCHGR